MLGFGVIMRSVESSATIKSAHDGTTLEFSAPNSNYYNASLCGSDFRGTASVYSYKPAHLAQFFRDLAIHWNGWTGQKEWGSLEGELTLVATIDSTGHIHLSVRLRSGPHPFNWKLSAVLLIEAGQLEQIASSMERFVQSISVASEDSDTRAGK
jgi:hypothetical protein